MTFKKIIELCKTKGIELIEFDTIEVSGCNRVKNINDFLKICGGIVGYVVRNYTSEEATEQETEALYNILPGKFSEWLKERYDREVQKICKRLEYESIVLLSIEHDFVWVQTNEFSKEEFKEIMKTIQDYEDKYHNELREIKNRRTEEINKLIDLEYKTKYANAKLKKDKESIIRELSGILLSKYGLDG